VLLVVNRAVIVLINCSVLSSFMEWNQIYWMLVYKRPKSWKVGEIGWNPSKVSGSIMDIFQLHIIVWPLDGHLICLMRWVFVDYDDCCFTHIGPPIVLTINNHGVLFFLSCSFISSYHMFWCLLLVTCFFYHLLQKWTWIPTWCLVATLILQSVWVLLVENEITMEDNNVFCDLGYYIWVQAW
jgi:hypothetical protein